MSVRLASLLFGMVFVVGCHAKQELTTPPPPLRPEPAPSLEKKDTGKDCEKTDSTLKPLEFGQRSIPEGAKLADEGHRNLKSSETAEIDRATREAYITEAVKNFITALAADPYNVSATYDLAASYARIGRNQCALNLLERVIQMRSHPSKHAEVEAVLDRLLGRKTTPLDGNFSNLRLDDGFRAMIAKICEDQNDANCVYGAGGKH
ncbi:MAG: hypothetical protein NT062_02365 [Proteobacteria bacterium]|nr:hypothetical protein [Pseudomonadota bacterium]